MRTEPKTILVVDDEPDILELVRLILAREGYRIHLADCGSRALEICDQNHGEIDLLLTDIMMPEMNGFALAQGVRDREQDLPVLFMTGGGAAALIGAGTDVRASLLTKPFDALSLVGAVKRLLQEPAPAKTA